MLTKNGNNIFYKLLLAEENEIGVKTVSGEDIDINAPRYSKPFTMVSNLNNVGSACTHALLLGNNNTPATADDYMWENDVTSKLTITLKGFTCVNGLASVSISCINASSEDVTVSELGWVVAAGSNNDKVLIARDVLSEPITVKPGEAQTFGMRLG